MVLLTVKKPRQAFLPRRAIRVVPYNCTFTNHHLCLSGFGSFEHNTMDGILRIFRIPEVAEVVLLDYRECWNYKYKSKSTKRHKKIEVIFVESLQSISDSYTYSMIFFTEARIFTVINEFFPESSKLLITSIPKRL